MSGNSNYLKIENILPRLCVCLVHICIFIEIHKQVEKILSSIIFGKNELYPYDIILSNRINH